MGKTLMAVPAEAAMTKGFRFPTTPATATQEEALGKMVRDYLRISFYASTQVTIKYQIFSSLILFKSERAVVKQRCTRK
jgi:hypothetical protein